MKKLILYITLFFSLLLISAIVSAQDGGASFQETIEKADNYFEEGDYINAKASYQCALKLNPDDEYAQNRLKESLGQMKAQQERSRLFTLRIMTADDLFNQGKYEEALTEYKKGLEIISDDEYATGKVKSIEKTLEERRLNEAEYNKNLGLGDKAFSSGDYSSAVEFYNAALKIRPENSQLKDKVTEAERLLAERRAAMDEYNAALETAEQFIARKAYDNAIEQLQEAIEMKPGEQAPRKRLEEVRSLKKTYEAYAAIVEQGDAFYMNKEFEKAEEKYQEALKVQPDDDYVKNLLERTRIAIADLESMKDANFEETLAKAEKFFSQEEYDMAMEEYKRALRMKPDQAYVKEKIDEINQIVSLRQSQQLAYEQTVAKADKLFKEENYAEALTEYQKANELKPLEPYPKVKIGEVNDLLAALKSKRETYNSLIEGADKLFFADDYVEAREQYQRALDMFPAEKYPQDQITMINEIIGLRDKYMKALTRADQLFAEGDYANALLEYRNAAQIDPDEPYPVEKIGEIELILAEELRMQEIEESYRNAVSQGDRLLDSRDLDQALASYNRALEIKPGEQYPKEKIIEVNELKKQISFDKKFDSVMTQGEEQVKSGDLKGAFITYDLALSMKPGDAGAMERRQEVAGMIDRIEQQEALQAEYDEAVAEADRLRDEEKLEEAVAAYREALAIKPDESYPQEQIASIENLLAAEAASEKLESDYAEAIRNGDESFGENDLNTALSYFKDASSLKPEEDYPRQRIEEINARLAEIALENEMQQKYQEAVANADALFESKDYEASIEKYNEASSIDPGQEYPVRKAEEARLLLDELEAKAELDSRYNEFMATAAGLLDEKKYQPALEKYQEASALKPEEQLPKDKIEEIRNIIDQQRLAAELDEKYNSLVESADRDFDMGRFDQALTSYTEATSVKPEEEHPKQRIGEIGEILKQRDLDDQYNALISTADALFSSGEYNSAITKYEQSLTLKPGEEYPGNQIALAKEELARIALQKQTDSSYNQAIFFADKHFNEGEYEAAQREYKVANSIKPSESYPTEQLAEIERIFAERERQAEINRKYNDAISRADAFFEDENYRDALTAYQEAKGIKPADPYPPARILEVKKKMEEQTEEIQAAFDLAITRADNSYNQQKWDMAKLHYETAAELIPESEYAQERLKEVNDRIQMERRMAQEDYDKAIADADKFYASKIYDNAIESYRKAAGLKPSEEYPVMMIRRIMKLLSERSIVDLNKDPLVIESNNTHKFDFTPVPVQDRKGNYMFFKAKNLTDSDFKLIISFGEGGAKNGGFVVRIPESSSEEEFIIRISAQYKWFSDDNNWVTMYPEGGDIQVSQVQISHSD